MAILVPSADQAGDWLVPPGDPREGDQTVRAPASTCGCPAVASQRSKGDAGVIRRDARRERDGAEVGDLVLVLAVVVHLPNFFGAGRELMK